MNSNIPIIFTKSEDKEDYRKWIIDHENGFVLNWPYSGKTASKNVKFHTASCDHVKSDLMFPCDSFWKIYANELPTLVQWAKSKRSFDLEDLARHACNCLGSKKLNSVFESAVSYVADTLVAQDIAPPERVETITKRIIRDTVLARDIKFKNQYRCQLCPATIELADGSFYAEAHHLKPLGSPHDGPDVAGNIVCVCPNCHAKLDFGAQTFTLSDLTKAEGHLVAPEFIEYHNVTICGKSA